MTAIRELRVFVEGRLWQKLRVWLPRDPSQNLAKTDASRISIAFTAKWADTGLSY
jgi:hypothetical protein